MLLVWGQTNTPIEQNWKCRLTYVDNHLIYDKGGTTIHREWKFLSINSVASIRDSILDLNVKTVKGRTMKVLEDNIRE